MGSFLQCAVVSTLYLSSAVAQAPAPGVFQAPALAAPEPVFALEADNPVASPTFDESYGPMSQDQAVMRKGIGELALAKSALTAAQDNAGYAKASQQELLAQKAANDAMEPYNSVAPLVPEAKAQILKVRKYAFLAAQHEKHAKLVEDGYRKIPSDAADEARKALTGWIKSDAEKTAEHTATIDNRGDKLANAVAAAAEPYHLALLRNQKFCEETYAKAKTAMSSSQELTAKAKKVALDGQQFQASGNGVEGRSMMSMAVGMINEAENLRKWAGKLYTQANTACSSAGGYTLAEQQAATNAAMTTIINAPMKLPKK